MVCERSNEMSRCRPFCSLEESSSIACDEVCDDYSITEVASHSVGICY
jgi:hypothetical protein